MKIFKQILFFLISIVVIGYAWTFFNEKFEFFCTNSQGSEYYQIYGVLGDYVGGILGTIIGFITLILVYLTYKSQKDELKLQSQLIAQQQFESTFFNMLNVHRELKNNLILDETKSLFFERKTNYEIHYYNLYNTYPDNTDINQQEARRDKFSKVIKNGVAVFGVIRNDYKNLNDKTSIEEHINLLNSTNLIQSTNRTLLSDLKDLKNNFGNDKNMLNKSFQLLFNKYQEYISHYCRNVYHILKFIREIELQNNVSYRKYADIFQSQLNVDEQFILFYNFIHFEDNEKGIYSTISLVNYYEFLENLGSNNLIDKQLHNNKKFYKFDIK